MLILAGIVLNLAVGENGMLQKTYQGSTVYSEQMAREKLEIVLMDLQMDKLTKEEYKAKEYQADALISYLGMGNVCLMDINQEAFFLEDGDIVLVSSDGLSRSMQERDILKIVRKNGKNMQNAANALTASLKNRKKQDNTSVVILRFDF